MVEYILGAFNVCDGVGNMHKRDRVKSEGNYRVVNGLHLPFCDRTSIAYVFS